MIQSRNCPQIIAQLVYELTWHRSTCCLSTASALRPFGFGLGESGQPVAPAHRHKHTEQLASHLSPAILTRMTGKSRERAAVAAAAVAVAVEVAVVGEREQ